MTYCPKPGSAADVMLAHMRLDPSRAYTIKELASAAKVRSDFVSVLLRPARLDGLVRRTEAETPFAPKRYAMASTDAPVKTRRAPGRRKLPPVCPLSILADEFPSVQLTPGWMYPAVANSVFEIAGGLSMRVECKVVYSDGSQTYMAQAIGASMRATCTVGDKQAAEALGRKLFGDDFDQAELSGRAGQAVYYRMTRKSEREGCDAN